jgi:alpha-tubulin suppressor-like RCC1 family protein
MDIRAIAAGTAFALALDARGMVYAWGENNQGQLGREQSDAFQPDIVRGLPPIAALAAGGAFALALGQDGSLWAWGQNDRGQLGDGTTTSHAKPQQVAGLGPVRLMAAGVEHALALDAAGMLMAWGDDSAGQLGFQVSGEKSLVPRPVNLASP